MKKKINSKLLAVENEIKKKKKLKKKKKKKRK